MSVPILATSSGILRFLFDFNPAGQLGLLRRMAGKPVAI